MFLTTEKKAIKILLKLNVDFLKILFAVYVPESVCRVFVCAFYYDYWIINPVLSFIVFRTAWVCQASPGVVKWIENWSI